MQVERILDSQIVRALNHGAEALPSDLVELRSHFRLIEDLLREKAAEHEPSWDALLQNAAEIETLQILQTAAAERTIATSSTSMYDVLAKLEIWRMLTEGCCEDEDHVDTTLRERLVLSTEADLVRLVRGAAR